MTNEQCKHPRVWPDGNCIQCGVLATMFPGKSDAHVVIPRVRSLTVIGRRWFDRRYGNTYFSAKAFINGEIAAEIGYEYGYGNHFEDRIVEQLEMMGRLPFITRHENGSRKGPISLLCRENGVEYVCTVSDVARKKDL